VTNDEMARAYLAQAEEILLEAENAHGRAVWNLVVRRAQEAVELALKAALRGAGIEVPRVHDVGVFLKEQRAKFPEAFRAEIERLASISRRLRREREVSFYGDEEAGAAPQQLYAEPDARMAPDDAGYVLEQCRRLIGQ
jgi:HEPN domain-containing protein